MTLDREKAARDLLAFYMEAGVDAIGENSVDRFADLARSRSGVLTFPRSSAGGGSHGAPVSGTPTRPLHGRPPRCRGRLGQS